VCPGRFSPAFRFICTSSSKRRCSRRTAAACAFFRLINSRAGVSSFSLIFRHQVFLRLK
jgi:hypothetical protein